MKKPCPFCGEITELSSVQFDDCMQPTYLQDWVIRCDHCGAMGPPCSTITQAEKAWDERKKRENCSS